MSWCQIPQDMFRGFVESMPRRITMRGTYTILGLHDIFKFVSDQLCSLLWSLSLPLGLHCNRTFDLYACWPDGTPGTITNVSCPYYLPWFQKVRHGMVLRRCGLDGIWVLANGTNTWRDSSQCEDDYEETSDEVVTPDLLLGFQVLYTVGYSLSLFTLLSALGILTLCRKLRCTRNYIHANLFFSFALRGISVIVKDILLEKRWGMQITEVSDWEVLISNEAAVGCRMAQVIMQYCILANHYWFVVEAMYLYNLLTGAGFFEKNIYILYLYFGWGTPVLFVTPWVTLKYLKENSECWALNDNMGYWWIIRVPILILCPTVYSDTFFLLITWMPSNSLCQLFCDFRHRLAKATLTLIPLFGIHEVVFIFGTDEQTSGILHYIKVFFSLFLNSFQVLRVVTFGGGVWSPTEALKNCRSVVLLPCFKIELIGPLLYSLRNFVRAAQSFLRASSSVIARKLMVVLQTEHIFSSVRKERS
uniref:Uncharacterized protein n=1 Tax=Leptobrachium leishanense TaxID=445787 RepID=A0A8C5QJ84_9ANUR